MADTTHPLPQSTVKNEPGFVRAIGLFDGTMIVVGSMIGSGIFIVSAAISRQTGSPGNLILTWVLTGLLTVSAALAYGELAAMFPHAGGQYIYLREAYSPLWGFLYGWTLFLVIQTGTIAAVAVGFARFLGVVFPAISPEAWIIHPINLGSRYAISLSLQQLVGVLMIVLLTFLNTLGVRLGKLIQNIFTSAKTLSLIGLILMGIFIGRNHAAIADNFSHFWTIRGAEPIEPGANFLRGWIPTVTAVERLFRPACRVRRCTSRFSFFRRRLEQHRFHRGGSQKSEARCGAFDGVRHDHRHNALLPRKPGVSSRAELFANPECA